MRIYTLHSRQSLPISMEKAWAFLSDPGNLKVITPEHMGFAIHSGAEQAMYPGQVIQYKVAPFPGIRTKWVTEITHVREGSYFVDEQRYGPYRLWHHKHFIKQLDDGVEMEDLIHYKLPFGLLGRLLHAWLVKKQLTKIFTYRKARLTELFGTLPDSTAELTFHSF